MYNILKMNIYNFLKCLLIVDLIMWQLQWFLQHEPIKMNVDEENGT